MSNYGCVFIVTAPCLCWTVALLHRRVLSASPKLSHSNLFFSLPFFFPRFTLPVSLLRTEWVNWPLFQSHGRKLWWLTGTDIIFLFYFFPLWPLRNSEFLIKLKKKKKQCHKLLRENWKLFLSLILVFFSVVHSVLRKKLQACFYKSCWNTLNRGRSKLFSMIFFFFLALYLYRF